MSLTNNSLCIKHLIVAEGEGFEPPEPFRVQWFSRPPPSTTRPSLRVELRPQFAWLTYCPATKTPCHQKSITPIDSRPRQTIVCRTGRKPLSQARTLT